VRYSGWGERLNPDGRAEVVDAKLPVLPPVIGDGGE
jgi:hypothetical protein